MESMTKRRTTTATTPEHSSLLSHVRVCTCGDPNCQLLGRWGADEPIPGYEPQPESDRPYAWWKFWAPRDA